MHAKVIHNYDKYCNSNINEHKEPKEQNYIDMQKCCAILQAGIPKALTQYDQTHSQQKAMLKEQKITPQNNSSAKRNVAK